MKTILVGIAILFACNLMFNSNVPQNKESTKQMSKSELSYELDLEERCKDWIYYRNKTYQFGKEGDKKNQEESRRKMTQFDRDLKAHFSEDQISKEISRLERQIVNIRNN